MREIVIVSAIRTAIGNFNGSLSTVSEPTDLGAYIVKAAVEKIGIDTECIAQAPYLLKQGPLGLPNELRENFK